MMIKALKSLTEVLWPEFQELDAALIAYLSEITEKVIREDVHGETGFDQPANAGVAGSNQALHWPIGSVGRL